MCPQELTLFYISKTYIIYTYLYWQPHYQYINIPFGNPQNAASPFIFHQTFNRHLSRNRSTQGSDIYLRAALEKSNRTTRRCPAGQIIEQLRKPYSTGGEAAASSPRIGLIVNYSALSDAACCNPCTRLATTLDDFNNFLSALRV